GGAPGPGGSPGRTDWAEHARHQPLDVEREAPPPPASGVTGAALGALGSCKRILIGRPRATREIGETLLPKWLALPIFSSDPISSVAYATEAAMAVLVVASLSALHLVLPISIAIAALLAIVVISYRQGGQAYARSAGPPAV